MKGKQFLLAGFLLPDAHALFYHVQRCVACDQGLVPYQQLPDALLQPAAGAPAPAHGGQPPSLPCGAAWHPQPAIQQSLFSPDCSEIVPRSLAG